MTAKSSYLKWLCALVILSLGVWGATGVELRDDVLDLLPGKAVRNDIELLQRMGLVNRVFISFDVEESDQNENGHTRKLIESAENVGRALSDSGLFKEVVYRLDEGYELYTIKQLWKYLPALATSEDLDWISSRLENNNLAKIISENFVRLNSPAGIPLVNQVRRDPLGIINILFNRLNNLKGEFSMTVTDGFFMSADGKSCMIWAESILPLTNSDSAEKVKEIVDSCLAGGSAKGVKSRIIGTMPHTLANSNTVKGDLRLLLPLAFFSLLAFLLFVLKGVRALLVMVIPLMAAPVAIAIVGFFFAKVSSIALGFGIVLLGISVDFSVHLYFALTGSDDRQKSQRAILRPIILATITTIGVFFVILFSAVPSHQQMATLAIAGLLIAVLLSWFLIPTIISVKDVNRLSGEVELDNQGCLPVSKPRWPLFKLSAWIVLIVAGIWAWPQLKYNGDLRSLDVPDQQIIKDEKVFKNTWQHHNEQTFIVSQGNSITEVLARNDLVYNKLQSLKIKGVQTVSALLNSPKTQQENIQAWTEFWSQHKETAEKNIRAAGIDSGFTDDAFLPFFDFLETPAQKMTPEVLLNGPLRPIFVSMLRVPDGHSARVDTEREILATTIILDHEHLQEQIIDIGNSQGINVISNSKWRLQVEELLKRDIARLSSAAALLIVIFSTLFFRNIAGVLAALAPVLSALSAMAVYGIIASKDLNMMHVLMGIMVIGISVDYGIFVVFAEKNKNMRATAKAVSVCAVSTVIGFGVLVLADHYALSTLGSTVLVGIGAAWPTALLISPVILMWNKRQCP